MPSALRLNIFNVVKTRLTNLGHILTDNEIYMIVGDVETQVAADATAQADAIADTGAWPDPTTAPGQ